jgi:hypothetical protein
LKEELICHSADWKWMMIELRIGKPPGLLGLR